MMWGLAAVIAGCGGGGGVTADGASDAPRDRADASSPDAGSDASPPDGDAAFDAPDDQPKDATADLTPDATPDASPDAMADLTSDGTSDAMPDGTGDTIPDAPRDAVVCVGAPATMRRTLFINFEGAVLDPGYSDATVNKTPLIAKRSTLPAFSGSSDLRTSIVATLTEALGSYDLAIVTVRPATGPYDMIVFGGSPANLELPADLDSVAPIDCGDGRKSDLAVVFDGTTSIRLANAALGAVGNMAGMDRVTRAGDCLGDRRNATAVCTYGANVSKDLTLALCGTTPQDEPAMLAVAYGCRP
jgi:hypothetical protein